MNKICITFDIDWAPDFAIREAAEKLIYNKIKCTWFTTHKSEYINELSRHSKIFEMGIHPNFLPGSTHGSSEAEVMENLCRIVPGAKTVRTHYLYQSTRILKMMSEDFGIETDCSLLLYKTPSIIPHYIYFRENSPGMCRIPFFWEDDIFMNDPEKYWNPYPELLKNNGLKIFNFHPVHTYLNSNSPGEYRLLKAKKSISEYNEDELSAYINTSKGTNVFFDTLIEYIKLSNSKTYTMSEIKNQFDKSTN